MKIILIGDSGHARVIAEAVVSAGGQIIARLDGKYIELVEKDGCAFGPVAKVHMLIEKEQAQVIIAIGANAVRKRIVERLALDADHYATAIHRDASVSPSAVIGPGTVVMPGAVINAEAVIGNHVIVNSSAVVEHDCVIEDYVHVASGAAVAGLVKLGEGVWIETGASVVPTKKIGKWSVVRAGSTVMEDVREFKTVVGVPAVEVK